MTPETRSAEPLLEALPIKCTTTDCEKGLHCWRVTKRMAKKHPRGHCIECGERLIDWDRLHGRDPLDVRYTFSQLRREYIRHHFWHVQIDQRAINAAHRIGRRAMPDAVERKLRSRIGPAHPFRDGGQTPLDRDPVAYAQHATASCCRKCIVEWHGIEEGRELCATEIRYLRDLALAYLDERMPELPDDPHRVPPIRTRS